MMARTFLNINFKITKICYFKHMNYWLSEQNYWENNRGFDKGVVIPTNLKFGLGNMNPIFSCHHFIENLLVISDLTNKYGVLNRQGQIIVDFQYDMIFPFSQGFAVFERNEKFGFLNHLGQEIIPAIYDDTMGNGKNCFVVQKDNRWFCVNSDHEITFIFNEYVQNPSPFIGEFAIILNQTRDKFAVINKQHNIVIDFGSYEIIERVDCEGWYDIFAVKNNNGYGFLNHNLQTMIPCQFEHYFFDPIEKQLLVKDIHHDDLIYINQQGDKIGQLCDD